MPDRPNVLFVLTDQFRADAVGADPNAPTDPAGDPVVDTPTLDALADGGTLFSRAYTPNPICVPARRCLWTGQTAATNGCTGGNSTEPWDFEHTLPELLTDAGYQTRLVGKHHAQPMYRGSPEETEFGFEATKTHVGTSVYEDDYGHWLRNREGDDRRGTGLSHEPTDARPWHSAEFEHPTNWTTRRALDFLESREESRPFFLTLSYVRPHAPLDPPQTYWDQYADRDLPEPAVGTWLDRLRDDPDATPTLREEPPRRDQRLRTGYYGLVSQIDHQLHRVLYELQWRHGIRDDTIVVFTSDHGEMLGDHHHWAKEAPFEGSARVPMILDLPDGIGPEQPAGQVVDRPVGIEDVMPTLLGLAGVDVPDSVEGEALHELVADPGRADHREAYHGESGTQPASHYLVKNDRKYVWFPDAGEELLFDLAADPDETTDVSRDAYYAEDLERCRERMAERLAGRAEGFVQDGQLVGPGV